MLFGRYLAYGISIVEAKEGIVILDIVKTTLKSRLKLVLNRSIIQCMILFYIGRQVIFGNL